MTTRIWIGALCGGAGVAIVGVGDAAFEVAGVVEFVKGRPLVIVGTGDGPA